MIGAQCAARLRNLNFTTHSMEAGQLATLKEIIEHDNRALAAVVGHNVTKPLALRAAEKRQSTAFLDSLNGPLLHFTP